jgi:hypothetical protein
MSNCPKCGKELILVPAGIAKATGKPYDSFWSCPDRECRFTMKNQTQGVQAKAMSNIAVKTEEKKWEEISTGKCRYGFALEEFKKGSPLNSETANKIIKWTNFAMTGKISEEELETISIPF